jgi:hypothetical protein
MKELKEMNELELRELRDKVQKSIDDYKNRDKIEVYTISEYGDVLYYLSPRNAWDYVELEPDLEDLFESELKFGKDNLNLFELDLCRDFEDELYTEDRMPEPGMKVSAWVEDTESYCDGTVLNENIKGEKAYLTNGIPFTKYKFLT